MSDDTVIHTEDVVAVARNALAELAAARETIKRLNRRSQIAEAGLLAKMETKPEERTFGRIFANSAAYMYREQNEELRASLATLREAVREYVEAHDAAEPHDLPDDEWAKWQSDNLGKTIDALNVLRSLVAHEDRT
jgi:CRISPR/Cas system CMR subunit Cmr4 (Cas7 group RAMP superfamily)